jgi:hypothetical protein
MKNEILEKKSSAVTLSDMEIFVFPELIYSLVLANIMSDRIWQWRSDPWFKDIDKLLPIKRIQRLKQYIMDNYVFNLDLETWGLSTKETELNRFKDFIDEDILKRSNALFGYEGDKYYFDIDIRRHFGLDNYDDEDIPYWKTETVEAMDAFQYKDNYPSGAGECVSLSTLYAAALFVIARIPLQDIYLMATPLHSQNYVDINDGILTNNRRIVTKNMWFNGTALSAKARRALEKENITIVSHESGYIHTIYNNATISPDNYNEFKQKLSKFLTTTLDSRILGNFMRCSRNLHGCIQVRWNFNGIDHYIGLERLFEYETRHPFFFTNDTRKNLMDKIDADEFHTSPMPGRIILNDLEEYIENNNVDFSNPADINELKSRFTQDCIKSEALMKCLIEFCITKPAFPDETTKQFLDTEPLGITVDMQREAIIERLDNIRESNETADLAFYAFRDFSRTDPIPFLYAALHRNPVGTKELRNKSIKEAIQLILNLDTLSIYSEDYRLAQPDEVWNYKRGDGIEKAILAVAVIMDRDPNNWVTLDINENEVILKSDSGKYIFEYNKRIQEQSWSIGPGKDYINILNI